MHSSVKNSRRPAYQTGLNLPIDLFFQSLARDSRVTRIELSPLAADEVAALIEASATDIGVAQALKDSGGNPLYLLELTRVALDVRLGDIVGIEKQSGEAIASNGLLENSAR